MQIRRSSDIRFGEEWPGRVSVETVFLKVALENDMRNPRSGKPKVVRDKGLERMLGAYLAATFQKVFCAPVKELLTPFGAV